LLRKKRGRCGVDTGTNRPDVPEAELAFDAAWRALRERRVLGHEGLLISATFSPDNRRIITVSDDGAARLWDADTGKPIGESLRGHEHGVTSAAFSPDGKRIVTASLEDVRQWDAETGTPIGEPLRRPGGLTSAAFSPDGKRIVIASLEDVRQWDRRLRQGAAPRWRCSSRHISSTELGLAGAATREQKQRVFSVCGRHSSAGASSEDHNGPNDTARFRRGGLCPAACHICDL